ncbi:MAG: sigma-54 dependent transcriptional regulator [Actinomycetota bacterium]|jgi:DNA-binding NtrC family response regulator|nr:sigma-54 dependent transcriptional regulator [Actinomycetota bacterium]MDA8166405.1 sigma-54 dependent transcriptional regulator [Actinomycetota bacterium]
MTFRVLIAEDEEITRNHLADVLRDEGFDVVSTGNGLDALNEIRSSDFDILIADIKMPRMDGLELLSQVKKVSPETEVLIVTGFGSINSAVDAIKKGAFDYLPKPFDLDELILKVRKVQEQNELRQENVALRTSLNMEKKIDVIAESKGMKKVLEVIDGIRESDCNVLLTGESGVGKNLLAKVIHYSSPRSERPFLSLNCATFSEELLASELFGHEKGAFTGATTQKPGLMKIADHGTLFFDEITEMAPNLQAKLLKAIEEREFYRVGGTKPVRVDARFIAATNQRIDQAIAQGTFRKDLYYRLNVMEIYVPPLRERKSDITPLSRFFLRKHSREYGKKIKKFTKDALDVLRRYSYPGNVRELENIIERAVILEKGPYITAESLPQSLLMFQIETTLEPDKVKSLAEINKEYVHSVLEMFGGNKSEASRVLGVSRTSLWRMLKEEE